VTTDRDENGHRDELGEDLWALVKTVGPPLKRIALLTTLSSRHLARASFRLEFIDGTLFKGRRFESGADAERVDLLSQLLDQRHFPRVVDRSGAALLVEWIDGHPVPSQLPDIDTWRHCGEVMGAMHVLRPSQELEARYGCTAAGWQTRLRANIDELARLRALDKREVQLALGLAGSSAPGDVATGLIHGDFCAENFIETTTGGIAVVDNETLSIDAYAYDLARTWSRWPMHRRHVQAFYEGYHRYRESTDFREHFLFWIIAVLTEAAVFRMRGATVGAQDLVERLKTLLEGDRPGDVFSI
jgi:tRNA A-37 threonylcarbamoyl transferase component Bud32